MTATTTPVRYNIREFRDTDLKQVLNLLQSALGGGPLGARTEGFFRWKHFENPFGRSYMLVADAGTRLVGLRAFLRWEFSARGQTLRAVRAVDTATHPDAQRTGIFSRLTGTAIDRLRSETDLVFNTPNDKSLPGYLKLGWDQVGKVPVRIVVSRPVHFARGLGTLRTSDGTGAPLPPTAGLPAASTFLSSEDLVAGLLAEAGTAENRLQTARSVDFLRWRYADASGLGYQALGDHGRPGLRGLVIFRLRRRGALRECSVADLIVRSGDLQTARGLLRSVKRATGADHLAASFAEGSTAAKAVRRSGGIPAPGGVTMVANPLRPGLVPDPVRLESWALTLGDLEVF